MVSENPDNFTPTTVLVIKEISEKVHDTVAIVVEKDSKFLLIKKAKGLADEGEWAFPGGHVDKGETITDAAKREGDEEIGEVEITEENPFFTFPHYVVKAREGPHRHNLYVFRAKLVDTVKPGTDAEDSGWFTKEEILDNPKVQEWTKNVLRKNCL